jgi:hypothetical protein
MRYGNLLRSLTVVLLIDTYGIYPYGSELRALLQPLHSYDQILSRHKFNAIDSNGIRIIRITPDAGEGVIRRFVVHQYDEKFAVDAVQPSAWEQFDDADLVGSCVQNLVF